MLIVVKMTFAYLTPRFLCQPQACVALAERASPTVVAQALGSLPMTDKPGKESRKGHNTVGTEAIFVW